MIERTLQAGVSAEYVLMDTWFTQQPLIQSILEIGLDGILKSSLKSDFIEGFGLSC